jgi:hypothetical protein
MPVLAQYSRIPRGLQGILEYCARTGIYAAEKQRQLLQDAGNDKEITCRGKRARTNRFHTAS